MFKLVNNELVELTEEEISANETIRAEIELFEATFGYKQKRAEEYPPLTDYLDGIVKGDEQQVSDYIAACLAVKAKYPKPQPT